MVNDDRLFAATLRSDLPTCDLHGLSPAQALDELEFFVYNEYRKKESALKIIYGIGTGVLSERVLGALRHNPLVIDVQESSGFCLVLLDRP